MEDAFTIGQRLKQEAIEAQSINDMNASWHMLRSEAYARDRGICWICHEFITLDEYDCGHLVDKSMGGSDIIENLAPMHKLCNLSKPKHRTIEEAIIWQLKPRHHQGIQQSAFSNIPTNAYPSYRNNHRKPKIKPQLSMIDLEKNKAIFQSSPVLQNTSDTIKLEVIKLLGRILDTPDISTNNLLQQTQSGISSAKPQTTSQQIQILNQPETLKYRRKRTMRQSIIRPPKPISQELLDKIKPNTICWIQGRPYGGAMWKVIPPPYKQEDLFTVRNTPPGAIDNGLGGIRDTLQIIDGNLTEEVIIKLGHVNIRITPNGKDKPSITFFNTEYSNVGKRTKTVGRGIGQIPIIEWYKAKIQGITFKDFIGNYPQS